MEESCRAGYRRMLSWKWRQDVTEARNVLERARTARWFHQHLLELSGAQEMVNHYPSPSAIPRFVQLLRVTIRRTDDIPLALQIGFFILMLPHKLARSDLPRFLDKIRNSPRPTGSDTRSDLERISRLRNPWLWLPVLGARDTCYVRAMTLYRFLDLRKRDLRIHFGIEPGRNLEDRLRGHAWVTVDGEVLEEPIHILAGRLHEIYFHPPVRDTKNTIRVVC